MLLVGQRNSTWRQGCLLTKEAASALHLINAASPEDTLVVVATHDCDLAQPPEREPIVEVIVGRLIQKCEGNYTHGKSSRTLHLQFEGDKPLWVELVSIDKQVISKNKLEQFFPNTSSKLSVSNFSTFQQWLASRYRRSAFPDEFENRFNNAGLVKKIAGIVKKYNTMITAVFFDVDGGEEIERTAREDLYTLDIYLLYETENDFDAAIAAANKAKLEIDKVFKERLFDAATGCWKDIELNNVEVISEQALTYYQARIFKKRNLDYISLATHPQQPILAV